MAAGIGKCVCPFVFGPANKSRKISFLIQALGVTSETLRMEKKRKGKGKVSAKPEYFYV